MDEEESDAEERADFTIWSRKDNEMLLRRIQDEVPEDDHCKYTVRIAHMDWTTIAFHNHSAKECKQQWYKIIDKVRNYRTISEMCTDGIALVKNPRNSNVQKTVKRTTHSSHPDFPKRPMPPTIQYFNKKYRKAKEKHPDKSRMELRIIIKKKFDELSEEKKVELKERYEEEIEKFKAAKAEFYQNHPELHPTKAEASKKFIILPDEKDNMEANDDCFIDHDLPSTSQDRVQEQASKPTKKRKQFTGSSNGNDKFKARKSKKANLSVDEGKELFVMENEHDYHVEHPHLSVKKVRKRLTKAFEEMSETSQNSYRAKAAESANLF